MHLVIHSTPCLVIILLLIVFNKVEGIASVPPYQRQKSGVKSESIEALAVQILQESIDYTNLVDLSAPERYRVIKLDFSWDREADLRSKAVLSLFKHPDGDFLINGVHEVDVSSSDYLDDFNKAEIENLLLRANALKTIRWNVGEPISPTILQHLERNNPSAKIYYRMPFGNLNLSSRQCFTRVWPYMATSKEIVAHRSIMNSTNIYALSANVIYETFTDKLSMRLLFETLSTCPNIKELDLSITSTRHPVQRTQGQPNYFDFRSNPNARFPPLEVLKLSGYDLDATDNWDREEIKSKDSENDDGTTGQKPILSRPTSSLRTNIEDWLTAMDWSALHTLNLEGASASALLTLQRAVPNLQHLTIAKLPPGDGYAAVDFIVNTKLPLETISLKSLKLESLDDLANGIINGHCTSLKHLTINARHGSNDTALVLDYTTISGLLSECTGLETLAIDIAPTADWDYALLNTLASHRRLRSLTLRFEVEYEGTQSATDESTTPTIGPLMTFATPTSKSYSRREHSSNEAVINSLTAPAIFRYLRKQKIGRPLEKLELIWSSPLGPVRVSYMGHDQSSAATYVCSVEESGRETCTTELPMTRSRALEYIF